MDDHPAVSIAPSPGALIRDAIAETNQRILRAFLNFLPRSSNAIANNNPTNVADRPPAEPSFFDPSSIFTSGYALGVLIMVILLNRIQHIVVPPRASFRTRHGITIPYDAAWDPPWTLTARFRMSLFALRRQLLPIRLDSTASRFFLSLPSLLHASRTLVLLTVTIMQVLNIYPSSSSSAIGNKIQSVGEWAMRKDMYQICWTTFCSACFVVLVGAVMAGLEGRSAFAPHFNLFGYACTLHAFGSPNFYLGKGLEHPTGALRPNQHILFIILLPLLQITVLHAMNVKKSWSTQRIIPSSLFGLISIAHFLYTLLTDPASHPYPTFLTNLVESSLLFIIVSTHFLDFFTRLMLSPPSEPGSDDPFFLAPSSWSTAIRSMSLVKSTDEFPVAIVKVGLACLDATNFVGLANEVAFVRGGGTLQQSEMAAFGLIDPEQNNERSTLRIGISQVISTPQDDESASPRTGLDHEVKRVRPQRTTQDGGASLPGVGGYWFDAMNQPEIRRLLWTMRAFATGFVIWTWSLFGVRRRARQSLGGRSRLGHQYHMSMQRTMPTTLQQLAEQDGEEDSDYVDDDQVADTSSEEGEEDVEDELQSRSASPSFLSPNDDVQNLYSDMTPGEAPVLLAHMQNQLVTRRRYGPIVGLNNKQPVDDESRRNCVICTVEPRVIICWPCRCLALCDDCRGSLAARSATSKHTCPCCRQNVEGYSRIFIP